ncbi:MAG: 4a-hydroxytetrahydrobiopterin dehydratase [Chloroflexi bacterium]|nr:4a-hydroxytetrahydrobiopterin dehydratase [Chloroflexota bacterium]
MKHAPLLSESDIEERLRRLTGWSLLGKEITKQYAFKSFVRAMLFVNHVAWLAEQADHHPDIAIAYNKVKLVLATHSEGGLTDKDFALAARIDKSLPLRTPGPGQAS